MPIYPLEEFEEYMSHRDIKVAVLAVPDGAATDVFELVTHAGIPGVLNFTAVELKCIECDFDTCPVRCVVQNVNIGLEIENLFYLVRMKNSGMLEENTRSEPNVRTERPNRSGIRR